MIKNGKHVLFTFMTQFCHFQSKKSLIPTQSLELDEYTGEFQAPWFWPKSCLKVSWGLYFCNEIAILLRRNGEEGLNYRVKGWLGTQEILP